MGNPHAVMLVDDGRRTGALGAWVEQHRASPGVNVGFCKLARDQVRLRVYERGTGETMACGTALVRLWWRAFVGACLMRVSTFKPLAAA
jgi:diaminopimelate epimerase